MHSKKTAVIVSRCRSLPEQSLNCRLYRISGFDSFSADHLQRVVTR